MLGKSCALCGGVVDRNGKYCKECNKSLIKGYDPKVIRKLATMPITANQKRVCASCKALEVCIYMEIMIDGCSDPIKVLNTSDTRIRAKAMGVI